MTILCGDGADGFGKALANQLLELHGVTDVELLHPDLGHSVEGKLNVSECGIVLGDLPLVIEGQPDADLDGHFHVDGGGLELAYERETDDVTHAGPVRDGGIEGRAKQGEVVGVGVINVGCEETEDVFGV